jgi:hypothetical protein
MKTDYNKLTVDIIGALWSDSLEQGCPVGVSPFFVMEQTARAGP